MSKPTVYWMPESPPCRTIYVVAKMIGIKDQIDWKRIDLSKQEQLSPEFIAINPFHTVPTFVDSDGFALFESRAIAMYLIQSRKSDSSLYPVNDLKRRSLIDQCLQLDLGTMYRNMSDVIYPIFRGGAPSLEKLPIFYEKMDLLEKYFEHVKSGPYLFGDEISLADITLFHTFTMCEPISDIDLKKYSKFNSWNKNVGEFIKKLDENDGTLTKAQENLCAFTKEILEKQKQN